MAYSPQGEQGADRGNTGYSGVRRQRVAQQQAILDLLRSGKPIRGAQSANPILGLIQNLTGVPANIPDLYGAQLDGQDVLVSRGGWNQRTAGAGPINLAGATWFPAQSGSDLIYKRGEGTKPGPYGEIFSASENDRGGGLDLSRPKPFAMTPEGQFDRYFKTPEFDYVFGAGSRGQGAPADAAAMEVLGNQLMAPEKDTNIASMYAAQSAMGRVNQAAIQDMYKDRPDLQKWAAANPMLAQREFLKAEQRRASEMPIAPDQETVMGDLGSRAQGEGGYSLEAFGGGEPKEGEEIINAVNFLKKKAGLQK